MSRPLKRAVYINVLKAMRHFRKGSYKKGKSIKDMKSLGANIVVIGGGTGLSTMLRGLKKYSENITAIVSVADDGGGSGVLREELNMLPPGDIRNCIVSLANAEPTMEKLMNYRFEDGIYKGQSFGNLFLAALNGMSGSFEEAVMKMNEVLAVTGRVLPVTNSNINLLAKFEDGSEVFGESKICLHKKVHGRIREVELMPKGAKALPDAVSAIKSADIIVIGPGSLYTSIIPNFLVDGICDAVKCSNALKIYVLNIMTQDGETENYTAFEHVKSLWRHSDNNIFDICIYNTRKISQEFSVQYAKEDAEQILIDRNEFEKAGLTLSGYDLMSDDINFARHNPNKLAKAILLEFYRHKKREGIFGVYDKMLVSKYEEGV